MSDKPKVSREAALRFLDEALRNVDLVDLDEDFVDDVAGALETFLRVRDQQCERSLA